MTTTTTPTTTTFSRIGPLRIQSDGKVGQSQKKKVCGKQADCAVARVRLLYVLGSGPANSQEGNNHAKSRRQKHATNNPARPTSQGKRARLCEQSIGSTCQPNIPGHPGQPSKTATRAHQQHKPRERAAAATHPQATNTHGQQRTTERRAQRTSKGETHFMSRREAQPCGKSAYSEPPDWTVCAVAQNPNCTS